MASILVKRPAKTALLRGQPNHLLYSVIPALEITLQLFRRAGNHPIGIAEIGVFGNTHNVELCPAVYVVEHHMLTSPHVADDLIRHKPFGKLIAIH